MSTLLNSYWDIVKYLQFMSLDDKISIHNILQTTENDPDVVYVKHISQNFQHYKAIR